MSVPIKITSTGQGLTGEFAHVPIRVIVDTNRTDGILVNGLQLRVDLSLSLEVHLPEHVQSRLLASTARS